MQRDGRRGGRGGRGEEGEKKKERRRREEEGRKGGSRVETTRECVKNVMEQRALTSRLKKKWSVRRRGLQCSAVCSLQLAVCICCRPSRRTRARPPRQCTCVLALPALPRLPTRPSASLLGTYALGLVTCGKLAPTLEWDGLGGPLPRFTGKAIR